MMDDDGHVIFGGPWGLKLPDICLIGGEKPHPGNVSRPGIEPGPAEKIEKCVGILITISCDAHISYSHTHNIT